jgi:HlyD family secretion protein
MTRWIKYTFTIVLLAVVAAGFAYVLTPKPVPVDIALIDRGAILVTVDEEGKTRIRDIYTVSAPITGRLLRLPVKVGDPVSAQTSPVASILPVSPSFLDQRTRSELNAGVEAADASVGLAEAELARTEAEERFAKSNMDRADRLAKSATISQSAFEKAVLNYDTAKAAVRQAEANLDLRRHEIESAKARLIEPDAIPDNDQPSCCIILYAPASGSVLKLVQESEMVVQAGSPILQIGDTGNLEIVVDLLSTDAVRVSQDAAARIESWGGPPLSARVSRIDPAGFTKVSALGIEEQRVTVVLQLTDRKEDWTSLGHDFRVFVRITEWVEENALRVPLSALFRAGSDWAVFSIEDGYARQTIVKIGHRNSRHAEILDGLEEGDRIILYPSDRIADGVATTGREED